MSWVKQHVAALVAAVLAVIFLIAGIISVTLLKPAQEVVASGTLNQPYVMTRAGLLPVLGPDSTVTVTADSADTVVVAYGTSADVKGWIGTAGYNEVVGIKSGMEELMLENHPAQSSDTAKPSESTGAGQTPELNAAQSGARSGAQSGHNESDTAQSGAQESPAGSDMWLDQQSGKGSVTMHLSNVGADRSILAAVEGSDHPQKITITWAVEHNNGWGVAWFSLAGIFAVLAAILLLLDLRRKPQETDVWSVGVDAALEDQSATQGRSSIMPDGDHTVTTQLDAEEIQALAAHKPQVQHNTDAAPQDLADSASGNSDTHADGEPSSEQAASQDMESTGTAKEDPTEDQLGDVLVAAEALDDLDHQTVEGALESEPQENEEPEANTGRHALAGLKGTTHEDGPQKVPTDTGVIDLSKTRPGVMLPSRRALREARERGEQRVVVGGKEFETGLIPLVSKQKGDKKDHADTETGAGPSLEQRTIDRGGWHSLMDRWTHKGGSDEA